MTYNVHDLLDDSDAVAHVIRSCRPDVACLQEVPRRLFATRRVQRLAGRTGMRWSAGGRGSGGTAVFTSPGIEVLANAVGRLPVDGRFTRTRGYALVQLSGLIVVSVHLPLRAHERLAHAQLVLARLAGSGPCVVAGDLNELPGGGAWSAFGALVADPDGGGPTYPSRAPTRRIDAVLVSAGVTVTRLAVAGAAEGLTAERLRAASDHLPLLAEISP